jgi:hypothetical protein
VKKPKNHLWKEDEQLFTSMKGHYVSIEEAEFFKKMQFKEEYEPSLSNDVIMSEFDNPNELYIVRELYDEYVIGVGTHEDNEVHLMNLYTALSLNLKDSGLINENITLLEWLRRRNYQGVRYNHNYYLL